MSAAANAVTTTARLYETRDAMRLLFGDKYAAYIKPVITQLNELAQTWQCSLLDAMMRASKEMSKRGAGGVELALVIAAYVEDVEGTFNEIEGAG